MRRYIKLYVTQIRSLFFLIAFKHFKYIAVKRNEITVFEIGFYIFGFICRFGFLYFSFRFGNIICTFIYCLLNIFRKAVPSNTLFIIGIFPCVILDSFSVRHPRIIHIVYRYGRSAYSVFIFQKTCSVFPACIALKKLIYSLFSACNQAAVRSNTFYNIIIADFVTFTANINCFGSFFIIAENT